MKESLWMHLSDVWQQILASGMGVVLMATLGRLMWHVKEVQLRRRHFWSPHLIWEMVTAFCIGFFADGVTNYLDISGKPALAVVIGMAYLGPRGMETILIKVLEAWGRTKAD